MGPRLRLGSRLRERLMVSLSSADYLVDRKRLNRQVTFWRAAVFVVAALAILAVGFRFGGWSGKSSAHIARVAISGVITGDDSTLKMLRDIEASKAAAVILTISSPGGTTEGSEVLYEEIRRVAARKPVVAVVESMAASGAYIAALGADRIFVHGNSIVGSIGVLVQFPNFSGLMDKVGVKLESIKSSPLKAAPNGLEPTSDAAREAIAGIVTDSFDWFKALVKERRQMSDEELALVDDGRVFSGRQGLKLKLADAMGGEREALEWLRGVKGVDKSLKVRDWRPERAFGNWGLKSLAASAAMAAGWPTLADVLRGETLGADASLDGLMSIWHVSSGN